MLDSFVDGVDKMRELERDGILYCPNRIVSDAPESVPCFADSIHVVSPRFPVCALHRKAAYLLGFFLGCLAGTVCNAHANVLGFSLGNAYEIPLSPLCVQNNAATHRLYSRPITQRLKLDPWKSDLLAGHNHISHSASTLV